ncbi:MAG: acyltransferase family protein [Bdellovibrio sp.]
MRENKKEHYYFIDTLRAIACFFVVLHHTLIYSQGSSFAEYYKDHLKFFFITVPLYLTISGFVHAQNGTFKKQSYRSYVSDKAKRILVPYFVLSLVTLVFRWAAESFNLLPMHEHQFTPFVWSNAVQRILFAGVEGHYYFLLILFLYLLALPAILHFFKNRTSVLLSFAFIFIVDALMRNRYELWHTNEWEPLNLLVAFIAGIKFFYFGFVLQKYYPVLQNILKKYGIPIAIVMTGLYGVVNHNVPAYHEQWLFLQLVAYFSFAYAVLNQPSKLIQLISSLSFGIYLLHQPYFIRFARIALGLMKLDPNAQFELTALIAFVSTAAFVWIISSNLWANRLILGQNWATKPTGRKLRRPLEPKLPTADSKA